MKTSHQLLAELSYPALAEYVTAARKDGESWETITKAVNARFDNGVKVAWSSLRNWYGEDAAA